MANSFEWLCERTECSTTMKLRKSSDAAEKPAIELFGSSA